MDSNETAESLAGDVKVFDDLLYESERQLRLALTYAVNNGCWQMVRPLVDAMEAIPTGKPRELQPTPLPVPMEAVVGAPGLLRYSAVMANLKAQGFIETAEKTEREIEGAGRPCPKHGYIDDPVIGLDPAQKRLIVACPLCSGETVRLMWEAQAVGESDG